MRELAEKSQTLGILARYPGFIGIWPGLPRLTGNSQDLPGSCQEYQDVKSWDPFLVCSLTSTSPYFFSKGRYKKVLKSERPNMYFETNFQAIFVLVCQCQANVFL